MTERIVDGRQAALEAGRIPRTQSELWERLFARVDRHDAYLTSIVVRWSEVVDDVMRDVVSHPIVVQGGAGARDMAERLTRDLEGAHAELQNGSADGGATAHAALLFLRLAWEMQRTCASIIRALGDNTPPELSGWVTALAEITGGEASGPLDPPHRMSAANGGMIRNRGSVLVVLGVLALAYFAGER